MSKGYVLVAPKGTIIAETFHEEKEEAEARAYTYLYSLYLWPRKYWKQWDEFVTERERKKWIVRPAKVVLT